MTEMKDRHTIDDIFRTGLEAYEPQPPDAVWEGIENRLGRRKPIAAWWTRAASVAAVLVVVFSGLWFLTLKQKPGTEKELLSVQEEKVERVEQPVMPAPAESLKPLPVVPAKKDREPTPPEETLATFQPEPVPSITIETASAEPVSPDYSLTLADIIIPELSGATPAERGLYQLKTDISAFMPDQKPLPLYSGRKEQRWSLGGQFAPAVYSYRHLTASEGNTDLKKYYDQIEEGIFTIAGGINLNYRATGRLVIYSGIYYAQMGQNINRVGEFILSSMGWETSEIHRKIAEKYYLVDHSTGTISSSNENLKIVHQPEEAFQATSLGRDPYEYRQETLETIDAQILQNYRFLEVPLMAKYRVIDKDIGVNLLGGISTNFLIDNSATLFLDGNIYSTIVTSDINPMNYSGTLGLGMDYEVLPGLLFNVEPTFKYYLNSFNQKNLIGSHPYSLGIFTGVRYVF